MLIHFVSDHQKAVARWRERRAHLIRAVDVAPEDLRDEAENVSPGLVGPPECLSFAPPAFALASPSPQRAMRGRRREGRSLLSSLS